MCFPRMWLTGLLCFSLILEVFRCAPQNKLDSGTDHVRWEGERSYQRSEEHAHQDPTTSVSNQDSRKVFKALTDAAATLNTFLVRAVSKETEDAPSPRNVTGESHRNFSHVFLENDRPVNENEITHKPVRPKMIFETSGDKITGKENFNRQPSGTLRNNTSNGASLHLNKSHEPYLNNTGETFENTTETAAKPTGDGIRLDVDSSQYQFQKAKDISGSSAFSATRCGDGFCWCYNVTADCSGHQDQLSYIPTLPARILYLRFSRNGLKSVESSSFFMNVTRLHSVDLTSNDIRRLAPDAFGKLTSLKELWLSNNIHLDIVRASAAIFNVRSLEKLNLNFTKASSLPESIFQRYPMPHLKELYIEHTHLRYWNATSFQPLQELEQLGLSGNDMGYIHTTNIHSLKRLLILRLEENDLHLFPRSCQFRTPIFPCLERLYLRKNKIKYMSDKLCLPRLQFLDLSQNLIVELKTGMFSYSGFPNLHTLYLERMVSIQSIQAFAFNNTSLAFLSLMYNNVNFLRSSVHGKSFKGLPALRFLQLGHNYLSNNKFTKLFESSTALTMVFLGATNLDKLTTDTFANFPYLTNITLHRNSLSSLPDGAFDGLKHLRSLDLSNNLIPVVSETTFSRETRQRLRHLDLSGNHFDCSCELLWFQGWLTSADPVFNTSYTTYKCYNLQHIDVASFHINEQRCLLSPDASKFIIIVVTMLIVMLTLLAIVFRYRWHIRLILYEAFRGKSDRSRLPANYFRYDMFVSYAEDDQPWVRRHLIPQLEDDLGVRLCIHQRDFIPGQNIVDNIFSSVGDSRKVMVVFSRHFARSQWCQFELALCLNHVIDHDDALLVVCVDDVTSSSDLTPTMMAVMNTTTYIQWAEGADAKASFWGRLRIALRDVLRETGVGDDCDRVQ